jgi:hypothetical protein
MPKQTIYIDNYSTDGNSDIVTNTASTIRININGMLNDLPPYAMLSLKQLEFVSNEDLAAGLIMVYKGTVSNQFNINKGDPILAICPFEYIKGTNYHHKAPEVSSPLMISGNIQQIEFGFKNVNNIPVSIAGKIFGILLEIETPSVGEPVAEYRKAIPL